MTMPVMSCGVAVLGMGTCGEDAALRLAASGLDVAGVEASLIDVNPADSELRELALQSPGGVAVAAPASPVLPAISAAAETSARTATPI